MTRRMPLILVLLALALPFPTAAAAPGQPPRGARPAAPWPPPQGKLRVVIDADTANEIDDQYALALALGRPDRFHIEGIVAAHFGDAGGSRGVDKSIEETKRVLEKAGMAGKVPVLRGADPLVYRDKPPTSEGVAFIIERAKAATPEDPLWLVLLGPATDAAAALLREPKIADRLIVFWHGRSAWPKECMNFNAVNDPKAARLLFELPCRFVLFDTGTFLTMPMEESRERIAPRGALGGYLHEIRSRRQQWMSPKKGVFDLGDIAALLDPSCVKFESTQAPRVTADMRYDFTRPQGQIVRIHEVDRDAAFRLLEDALRKVEGVKPLVPSPPPGTSR